MLQHSPKGLHLRIDLYDEVGIGGGASGVAGGLLHPYSPKGSCYIFETCPTLALGIKCYFSFNVFHHCLHFPLEFTDGLM